MRWAGLHPVPGALGQVGWAFEYNDRLGRLEFLLLRLNGIPREFCPGCEPDLLVRQMRQLDRAD